MRKGEIGEVYNIGTLDELSNIEVANILASQMKPGSRKNEWITCGMDRQFNDRRYAVDSGKLHKLGWKQKVSFLQGIEKTIDWYDAHGNNVWGDISHLMTPFPTKSAFTNH